MTTQFNSLLQCVSYYHRQIDEMLMLHQEAVIVQDIPLADEALRLFTRLLKTHIELEDKLLIPQHEKIRGEIRWRTRVYKDEHTKLHELLNKLQIMIKKAPEASELRRWVIEFIDYERTFKNVMEHHEEREEKGLLLELDHALDQDTLNQMITECHLVWQETYDGLRDDIEDIRKRLP
ncbi:MAG: hemerythrin domain-containing protein [Ketobacteraceae bacterium]|nr:hemerythrin domain-containing protein [Ketobacteraceae bacterium]